MYAGIRLIQVHHAGDVLFLANRSCHYVEAINLWILPAMRYRSSQPTKQRSVRRSSPLVGKERAVSELPFYDMSCSLDSCCILTNVFHFTASGQERQVKLESCEIVWTDKRHTLYKPQDLELIILPMSSVLLVDANVHREAAHWSL